MMVTLNGNQELIEQSIDKQNLQNPSIHYKCLQEYNSLDNLVGNLNI